MSDEKKNDDERSINIGGHVEGNIVEIGGSQTFQGNVTINAGATDNNAEVEKQLNEQVAALTAELDKLKADHAAEVEEVKLALEDAIAEAQKEEPDKRRLEIRGENLKKAAENLATVAPIAVQIARTLTMIG